MPRNPTADRQTLSTLLGQLRTNRADIKTALASLPAPGARSAAQRREALVLRTCALLVTWCITSSGAAVDSDRDDPGT